MNAPAAEQMYRIGEVADLVGLTTRTIRYWEELGLLHPDVDRPKGTHRCYTDMDIARLRELARFRDLLGLSLEELVTLTEAEQARASLRYEWADTATDTERVRIIDAAVELVRQQLELVTTRQHTLAEFATELQTKLNTLEQRRRQLGPKRTSKSAPRRSRA